MSDDAKTFLEQWTEENVTAASSSSAAEQLAEECIRDAKGAGYTRNELEEAAGELSDDEHDLISFFEAAIENALENADEEE